jgi:hypothetical protein
MERRNGPRSVALVLCPVWFPISHRPDQTWRSPSTAAPFFVFEAPKPIGSPPARSGPLPSVTARCGFPPTQRRAARSESTATTERPTCSSYSPVDGAAASHMPANERTRGNARYGKQERSGWLLAGVQAFLSHCPIGRKGCTRALMCVSGMLRKQPRCRQMPYHSVGSIGFARLRANCG